ncbi:DUF4097 family beta strand repeat-containing protein [Thalassotalea euphylliae]|uniref:DUF4097 domain-containing protein n=1 Tax=Thalassotalea euphylliae TaxID=1655234 RepID=A0A3E0U2S7_9GAMM|nr:DUF4097 family beta strand repeat-containing protein [Thalassotalea euphylliae]REL31020.1 hypothetical protein DXX94_10020 [Thalassotalea euphylliae]
MKGTTLLSSAFSRLGLPVGLVLGIATAFNAYAGERIDETLSADGLSLVNIENMRGSVKIIGHDDDEVSVSGELGEKVDRFIFEKSGNMLRVKVVYRSTRHSNNSSGSRFTVAMPKSLSMNFEGVSSDVEVLDLDSHIEVKTVSGDIVAKELKDNIELSSVSGDIDSRDLAGKIRLSTISGKIDDRDSSGRLRLKAVSGDVETRSTAQQVSLSVVSGDIEFELGEVEELAIASVSGDASGSLTLLHHGDVKVSGVSSDIELAFENDVNADFRLHASAGGDIVNRITNDKATRAKYGPSSKLSFTAGNGTGTVRGNVVSGEIKVRSK